MIDMHVNYQQIPLGCGIYEQQNTSDILKIIQ